MEKFKDKVIVVPVRIYIVVLVILFFFFVYTGAVTGKLLISPPKPNEHYGFKVRKFKTYGIDPNKVIDDLEKEVADLREENLVLKGKNSELEQSANSESYEEEVPTDSQENIPSDSGEPGPSSQSFEDETKSPDEEKKKPTKSKEDDPVTIIE